MILCRASAGDVPALHDIAERGYGVYVERIGRRPAPMDDDYDGDEFQRVYMSKRLG